MAIDDRSSVAGQYLDQGKGKGVSARVDNSEADAIRWECDKYPGAGGYLRTADPAGEYRREHRPDL